jgi:hypothetical protein
MRATPHAFSPLQLRPISNRRDRFCLLLPLTSDVRTYVVLDGGGDHFFEAAEAVGVVLEEGVGGFLATQHVPRQPSHLTLKPRRHLLDRRVQLHLQLRHFLPHLQFRQTDRLNE